MPSGMRKAMAYPSRYGSTRRRKKPPPLIPGGCPLPEEWSRRPIKIRDDQIKIAANPARLAEETCRIIARTAEGETPDIALGVCDPDMNVALDAALRQYGWSLHNPEGKPFAGSGVMDLLRNLQRALEEKGRRAPSIPWRAPPCSAPP